LGQSSRKKRRRKKEEETRHSETTTYLGRGREKRKKDCQDEKRKEEGGKGIEKRDFHSTFGPARTLLSHARNAAPGPGQGHIGALKKGGEKRGEKKKKKKKVLTACPDRSLSFSAFRPLARRK